MPDQRKLEEIICRMRSDYIPEHKAAADDYIREGFSTDTLLSIIENEQQPNLVSMYFYISGKRSDEETKNAWNYLYQRFETSPKEFITRSYSPWDLSDKNRYLLFSARKYLLLETKIEIFRAYVERIKNEAMPILRHTTSSQADSFPIAIYYQWLLNFFINSSYKELSINNTSSIGQAPKINIDFDSINQEVQKLLADSTFTEYVAKVKETYQYRTNNWLFAIGLEWERICQDICRVHYIDVLFNNQGIRLKNNSIPDIVVGNIKRGDAGKITYASMIVECKKSVYFNSAFDTLNNEATDKYINYCDLLEFWVLEKPDNFIKPNHPKVKYLFSQDLLNADWIPERLKHDIKLLLKVLDIVNILAQISVLNVTDKIRLEIENLLRFPPLPPKKETEPKPKPAFNIRQYSLDGKLLKEFASVQKASLETGLRVDTITTVTSGRRNSAGGFLWQKCPSDSKVENTLPPSTTLDLDGKNVMQVDKNGEIIATYNTIGQAAKQSGISRRSISDALKGIEKTAGGFIWVLVEAQAGE